MIKLANNDKEELQQIYFDNYKLIENVCYPYLKRIPGEDLEDLTQSCWLQICKKYSEYITNPTPDFQFWLVSVCRTTMHDISRALTTQKRAIRMYCTSLDALTNGKDKYL